MKNATLTVSFESEKLDALTYHMGKKEADLQAELNDTILAKTGCCPMRTKLPLFLKWGIKFEKPFVVEERAARKVAYADRFELEQEIMNRRCAYDEDEYAGMPYPPDSDSDRSGGLLQTPVPEHEPPALPAMPLRTD